jgi:PAS domain S-box-containing protein
VAVLLELLRLADAAGGALWSTEGPDVSDVSLALVARAGEEPTTGLPQHVPDLAALRHWSGAFQGSQMVTLTDDPPTTAVVLWSHPNASLDNEGVRIVQLARHELAVALDSSRLHGVLDRERQDLRAIVDGATDCILQVDAAGLVVRLNPAGEQLLGISAAEALGRSCAEVLGCGAAGGHGAEGCPLASVWAQGDSIAYQETAVRSASGAPIVVAGSYTATLGGADRARATAILRDISAVRALEELREGFVATVSHELRTPLALIRGYAESLLRLQLDENQQRAYVERIDEASRRLTALVDQILDITHLQADPLILDRSRTSFGALVTRLQSDLAMAGGHARLVTAFDGDLPLLDVDVNRVGQVLSNVVGNALKYAPGSSPVVLGATVEGNRLAVSVDDEGVGVPESERALVQEPFHRAWNVRESRIPGTGLGLFICRRLVEAHGGRLTIGDRPDGSPGTRVCFTLPLADG